MERLCSSNTEIGNFAHSKHRKKLTRGFNICIERLWTNNFEWETRGTSNCPRQLRFLMWITGALSSFQANGTSNHLNWFWKEQSWAIQCSSSNSKALQVSDWNGWWCKCFNNEKMLEGKLKKYKWTTPFGIVFPFSIEKRMVNTDTPHFWHYLFLCLFLFDPLLPEPLSLLSQSFLKKLGDSRNVCGHS